MITGATHRDYNRHVSDKSSEETRNQIRSATIRAMTTTDNSIAPNVEVNRRTLADLSIRWRPYERLLLLAYISVLMMFEIRAAYLRPFWFDEIATVIISSQPTLSQMFRAIPFDGNPPLYFLLVRPFLYLPIHSELAARIPTLLSFNLGLFLTYLFVRRSASPAFALVALSLLWSGVAGPTAIDARPYALLICLTALAACSWQTATLGGNRILGLIGITASMVGAVLAHQYGMIYIVLPIGSAELVRMVRSKKIDFAVFAALLLGTIPAFFTIPVTLRAQAPLLNVIRTSTSFANRPRMGDLAFYSGIIPLELPIAVTAILIGYGIFVVSERPKGPQGSEVQRESSGGEWVIAAMLTLLVPVMLIITRLGTNYYGLRYAIGTALGTSMLSGIALTTISRRFHWFNLVAYAAIAYCLQIGVFTWSHLLPIQPGDGLENDPLFLQAPSNEPIVIADPAIFPPTWWYTRSKFPSRVHCLSDLAYASKTVNPVSEYSLTMERQFGAPPLDDYSVFTAANSHFLLYVVNTRFDKAEAEWVPNRLVRDGWQLTLIGTEDVHRLYRVNRLQ